MWMGGQNKERKDKNAPRESVSAVLLRLFVVGREKVRREKRGGEVKGSVREIQGIYTAQTTQHPCNVKKKLKFNPAP